MRPFTPERAPVFAKNGMSCASTPIAAAVGRDILKVGGNAADAALAMAAVVSVAEPMMNGLGGDCMILAHWNGAFYGINGSGRSGARLTLKNLEAAGFSSMPQAGAASVSVPGALDGYLALHARFGSMDFADIVEPAATYAEDGIAVGAKIAQVWEWGALKLKRFSADPSPYLPDGSPPRPGQIFRQKDLADTWRAVGRNGRAAFYGGTMRERILDALHASGPCWLDSADFDATHAEWVEPIRGSYRGRTILELPPNGQGLVALMALGMLEGFDMAQLFADDEAEASHVILEAVKLAFADAAHVADPRFAATPVDRLLSSDYLKARRALIEPDRALEAPVAGSLFGDTTYLTVVDRDRNAVSLITSISGVFGSGVIVPGTGVVLHNRGAEFAMDPSHPNAAAPGKRVRHSILPAMMLAEDGSLALSFGCMGANMQPQGQAQILINLVDRGMDLQRALDAPRVRALDARRVSVEPHWDPDFATKLAARGHRIVNGEAAPDDWTAPHDFMRSFTGGAQAIALDGETLCGASDPRLDGIASPL